MVKPERAMASFVLKPKNVMQNGTNTLPPPTPAIVDIDIVAINMIRPKNSGPITGKTSLC